MLGEDFTTVLAGVFNQVAHAVSLIHLLSSACVVTGVAWIDRLGLMHFDIVYLDFIYSSLDGFLADLTLPQLVGTSSNQHLIDHSVLTFADVLLQFDLFRRTKCSVNLSLQEWNSKGEFFCALSGSLLHLTSYVILLHPTPRLRRFRLQIHLQ